MNNVFSIIRVKCLNVFIHLFIEITIYATFVHPYTSMCNMCYMSICKAHQMDIKHTYIRFIIIYICIKGRVSESWYWQVKGWSIYLLLNVLSILYITISYTYRLIIKYFNIDENLFVFSLTWPFWLYSLFKYYFNICHGPPN